VRHPAPQLRYRSTAKSIAVRKLQSQQKLLKNLHGGLRCDMRATPRPTPPLPQLRKIKQIAPAQKFVRWGLHHSLRNSASAAPQNQLHSAECSCRKSCLKICVVGCEVLREKLGSGAKPATPPTPQLRICITAKSIAPCRMHL